MKKYLIGFYRKNKQITAIYSHTNIFYDIIPVGYERILSKRAMRADIVPISLIQNTLLDSAWSVSPLYQYTEKTRFLERVFMNNAVILTTPDSKSEYAILTYAPASEPSMSRAGIVLKINNGRIEPITIDINNESFLLEVKGCGSPQGGFLPIHDRLVSSGAISKSIEITGASVYKGIYREFVNLSNIQLHKSSNMDLVQLIPVAHRQFKMEDQYPGSYGQLLRLVPSSLRMSFKGNADLDLINNASVEDFFREAGQQLGLLLEGAHPLIHYNVNPNNMIYVSEHHYVLTDLEEAEAIHEQHLSLDFMKTAIYPALMQASTSNQLHLLQGFFSVSTVKKLKTSETLQELNNGILTHFSLEILNVRFNHWHDRLNVANPETIFFAEPAIQNAFYFQKKYFGQTNLAGNPCEWLSNQLLPLLKKKLELIEYYLQFLKKYSFDCLYTCWHRSKENLLPQTQLEFEESIHQIYPGILEIYHQKDVCLMIDLNKSIPIETLDTLFIEVPSHELHLIERKIQLLQVLAEADQYLKTGKIIYPEALFTTFSFKTRQSIQYRNLLGYIAPAVLQLLVYIKNELNMLDSVDVHKLSKDKKAFYAFYSQFLINMQGVLYESPLSYARLMN